MKSPKKQEGPRHEYRRHDDYIRWANWWANGVVVALLVFWSAVYWVKTCTG